MPKITVVIPAYNVAKYIKQTIESTLNQTGNDYEVVVVDDGSKDETGNICDWYAARNEKIRVIHQDNGGVMAARLTGVEHSKGEWITFLDGDDRLTTNAIGSFINQIDENVDIIWGRKVHINEDGAVLFVEKPQKEKILDKTKYQDVVCKRFKSLHALLLRKELLQHNIIIDRKITNNEDIIFNLFLSSNVRNVKIIGDIVHQYVERGDSISKKKWDESYWYALFAYIDNNYKKFQLDDEVYNSFCLNRLCNLIRSKRNYHFNYNDESIKKYRDLSYKFRYGINGNIALFVLKHPRKRIIQMLSFHPRALFHSI